MGVAQKSLINRCSVLDTDLYIVPKAIYILYNWSLIVLCEVVFKASIGRRVECRISVVIYSDKIYTKLVTVQGGSESGFPVYSEDVSRIRRWFVVESFPRPIKLYVLLDGLLLTQSQIVIGVLIMTLFLGIVSLR